MLPIDDIDHQFLENGILVAYTMDSESNNHEEQITSTEYLSCNLASVWVTLTVLSLDLIASLSSFMERIQQCHGSVVL